MAVLLELGLAKAGTWGLKPGLPYRAGTPLLCQWLPPSSVLAGNWNQELEEDIKHRYPEIGYSQFSWHAHAFLLLNL